MVFPPVETASEEGILVSTYEITEELVIAAYNEGIFPWPLTNEFITWFAPPKRAVLFFDEVKSSLKRSVKKYEVSFNRNFEDVIRLCASVPRKNQKGTWITEQIIDVYTKLHHRGFAQSVEVFEDSKLVGGLYGVGFRKFFAAESMFHLKPNASKVALYHLIEKLKSDGVSFIDCQVMNPFLKTLGVREISREDFMSLLEAC